MSNALLNPETWDLGEPGTAHTLLIDTGVSTATPEEKDPKALAIPSPTYPLQPSLEIATYDGRGGAPYGDAILVTVLLRPSTSPGPTLLIDGRADLPVGPVTLPRPVNAAEDHKGCFAPILFSSIQSGFPVHTHQFTTRVELVMNDVINGGEQVLQTAVLGNSSDTEAFADAFAMPYPTSQSVTRVGFSWRHYARSGIGTGEYKTNYRDLGTLSSALARLHDVYNDMVPQQKLPAEPLGTVDPQATDPAKVPVNAKYAEMPGLHAALLAYAAGKTGRFGPNSEYELVNEPFVFESRRVLSPVLRVTVESTHKPDGGPYMWTLSSGSDSAAEYYQGWIARADEKVPGLEKAFREAADQMQRDKTDVPITDRWDALKALFVPTGTNTRIPVLATAFGEYRGGAGAIERVRVFGPVLVHKASSRGAKPRDERSVWLKDAYAAVAVAQSAATLDADAILTKTLMHNVAIIDALPSETPDGTVTLEVGMTATTSSVPLTVPRVHVDCFQTTGVLPLGVQTSLGIFLPEGAMTTTEMARGVDGEHAEKRLQATDIAARLGLRRSAESNQAIIALSDLILHEVLYDKGIDAREPNSDRDNSYIIASAVRRALQHARHASSVLKSLLTAPEQVVVKEDDPRFWTMHGGRAAVLCMRRLACWQLATLWTPLCRASAAAFCASLDKLGRLNHMPVHPVAFPIMPLQSMLLWPREETLARTQGSPLIELQVDNTVRQPRFGKGLGGAQIYAAQQSMARSTRLLRGLRAGRNEEFIVAAVAARPVLVGLAMSFGQLYTDLNDSLSGTDASPDAVAEANSILVNTAELLPPVRNVTAEVLAAAWAKRALGVFDRRRAVKRGEAREEDVPLEDVFAALAVSKAEAPTLYFVPSGNTLGTKPGSAVNMAMSEMRVFTVHLAWASVEAPAARTLALKLLLCRPNDGGLTAATVPYSHPLQMRHVVVDSKSTLEVPVSLDAHGSMVDNARCIMFTSERLMQALTFARAGVRSVPDGGAPVHELVTVDAMLPGSARAPDPEQARRMKILYASIAIARGLAANVLVRVPAVRADADTDSLEASELASSASKFNALAASLARRDTVPAVPLVSLGEIALAVASTFT